MGLGDPHSRLYIWVTSSLPAKPWLHLSSIFIIIGLDYYFPWVPKFYIIHIHCNILDKYKRMWASGGRILIIPFYVCIQEHMLHFYFLLCCFPLLRSCLTNCFLNLLKLRLHYICFHLSKKLCKNSIKGYINSCIRGAVFDLNSLTKWDWESVQNPCTGHTWTISAKCIQLNRGFSCIYISLKTGTYSSG